MAPISRPRRTAPGGCRQLCQHRPRSTGIAVPDPGRSRSTSSSRSRRTGSPNCRRAWWPGPAAGRRATTAPAPELDDGHVPDARQLGRHRHRHRQGQGALCERRRATCSRTSSSTPPADAPPSTAAVVIPVTALRHGPNGDFVYVVKGGNTVELRNVTRGDAGVRQRRRSTPGSQVGEVVVTEGGDRLKDGARVQTARRPAGRCGLGPAPRRERRRVGGAGRLGRIRRVRGARGGHHRRASEARS